MPGSMARVNYCCWRCVMPRVSAIGDIAVVVIGVSYAWCGECCCCCARVEGKLGRRRGIIVLQFWLGHLDIVSILLSLAASPYVSEFVKGTCAVACQPLFTAILIFFSIVS
jgi:hypothetical protein